MEQFDPALFGDDPATMTFGGHNVVFVKGDEPGAAYVVRSGMVELRRAGRAVESVGPGGMFGEMAVIDQQDRSASAVAIRPTELIVIDRDAFHALIAERPDFAVKVMQVLTRRLRSANAAVTDSAYQVA